MAKQSAGILLYRFVDGGLECLLGHPGGPFWARKDAGVWSIPKGEFGDEEPPLTAALREFEEETGVRLSGDFIPLTPVRQKGGKVVYAFAQERSLDPAAFTSNTFEMEWPLRSGRMQAFPEIDRAEWFDAETARLKLNETQALLITELTTLLGL